MVDPFQGSVENSSQTCPTKLCLDFLTLLACCGQGVKGFLLKKAVSVVLVSHALIIAQVVRQSTFLRPLPSVETK